MGMRVSLLRMLLVLALVAVALAVAACGPSTVGPMTATVESTLCAPTKEAQGTNVEPTVPFEASLCFSAPPRLGQEVDLTLTVTARPGRETPLGTSTVEFQVPQEGFKVLAGEPRWQGDVALQSQFNLKVAAYSIGEWPVTATYTRYFRAGQYEGLPRTLCVNVTAEGATVRASPYPGSCVIVRPGEFTPGVPAIPAMTETPTPPSGKPALSPNVYPKGRP